MIRRLLKYILKARVFFVRHLRLKTIWTDELPDDLSPKHVYVVGEGQHLWFVAMLCPCGCNAVLQMSLMKGTGARWKLSKHRDGTISLFPSILRNKGCKSHYFLRNGQINYFTSSRK